jgi:putative (di)nucleoside polyphosphate hydrolase
MGAPEFSYRPCVGVTLFNRDGKVFVGRRRNDAVPEHVTAEYSWQMPQGGINRREEPRDAVFRELFEETNIRSAEIIAEAPRWYAYDLPAFMLKRSWKSKYVGQTQKWFALRFLGDESEIDVLNPAGGEHRPEFDEWRWEYLERLPSLIIPFKRPVYENVVRDFAPWAKVEDNTDDGQQE